MRLKRPTKIALGVVGAMAGLAVGMLVLSDRVVTAAGDHRIFHSAAEVPETRVALVLGTAPTIQGRKNLYFEGRMASAAELYKAGKVRKILVSGDNGRREYSEPDAMRDALVKRGVLVGDVVLDYAGFRTLDSVVRAKEIFGVEECVIVTDDFHLPRSLYIARKLGVKAVGFCGVQVPTSYAPWIGVREAMARALVVLDVNVLRRKPRYLGKREPIG